LFRIPKTVNKLLVFCSNPKFLAWQLGKYGIYLDKFRLIKTSDHLQPLQPGIAEVKSENDEEVINFIQNAPIKAFRIFKTARYKDNVPIGFYYQAMKNLLGLLRGESIYIKSRDPEIRQKFYEVAEEINKEHNFNCTLDYDEFDYVFESREYNDNGRKILVTWVYGPGFPNKKA